MTSRFIASYPDLAEVCGEFCRQEWIALDTEFMRERTYYAKLCLVQIGTPHEIVCIDPLAIDDLTPLVDLLCNQGVLKVMHAARQDMEVFHDLWRTRRASADAGESVGPVPGPVFDTQVAAGYLGYEDQIGYAALVKSITGTDLDKSHTRTDWSSRPLSPEQRRYAEDDVRYLRDVYVALAKALETAGRSHWPLQDFARLSDPSLYESSPDDAWQRVRNVQQLDVRARRALRQLAAWRERAARSSDLPRSWVVSDSALLDLARRRPSDSATLGAVGGLTQRAVHRWGAGILEAIAAADRPGVQEMRPPRQMLDADQTEIYRRMAAEVDRVAREIGISSALLAPRRDVQRLVLGERDLALLTGWRRELVGENLIALLAQVPAADKPAPAGSLAGVRF